MKRSTGFLDKLILITYLTQKKKILINKTKKDRLKIANAETTCLMQS